MRPGTKVKMSEAFKKALIDNDCNEHVEEFGNCIGVVVGLADYGNGILGPDIDIYWQPSNLEYRYEPKSLVIVKKMANKKMAKKKNEPVATLSGESGWAKIIGDSLVQTLDKRKDERIQHELDVASAAELFHKLWDESKNSSDYNKDNWKKMQLLLDKLSIPV